MTKIWKRKRKAGKPNALTLAAFLLSMAICPALPPMVVARTVQAENSYVILQLPDSFKPQKRHAGFFSKDAGATIMILDLPRNAFDRFTRHFVKELEKKGYSEVRHGRLPGRKDEHLFFFARQHTPVGQFDKYLLIFRNSQRAAYVTITVNPIERVETPLSYIEAQNILARVSLSNRRAVVAKNYQLAFTGDFRERNTIAGSTSLYVLKKKRTWPGPRENSAVRPMFVIAPSLSRQQLEDLTKTGRKLMRGFARFRDMRLEAEEDLVVDGLPGYGLSGSATDSTSNQKTGVYQLILANPQGGYFRLVGIAPRKDFGYYLPQFRAMAASFRQTGPNRARQSQTGNDKMMAQ